MNKKHKKYFSPKKSSESIPLSQNSMHYQEECNKLTAQLIVLNCMCLSKFAHSGNFTKLLNIITPSFLPPVYVFIKGVGKAFLVFIPNRLISGGLKPVLIHTKKTMCSSYPVFYD